MIFAVAFDCISLVRFVSRLVNTPKSEEKKTNARNNNNNQRERKQLAEKKETNSLSFSFIEQRTWPSHLSPLQPSSPFRPPPAFR